MHYAERRVYGGFCYFQQREHRRAPPCPRGAGKDARYIDFHHGNGLQDIFYHRDDVLVVSLHGHPNYAYPYFASRALRRAAVTAASLGFNRNYPLLEGVGDAQYF